jgi:hypothetical protein
VSAPLIFSDFEDSIVELSGEIYYNPIYPLIPFICLFAFAGSSDKMKAGYQSRLFYS